MAEGITTNFTATGTSAEFSVTNRSSLLYWADFSGPGAGTVQLQVKMSDGTWVPADSAVTATMATAEVADSPSTNTRHYRWNCSAYTSGTITCYLE